MVPKFIQFSFIVTNWKNRIQFWEASDCALSMEHTQANMRVLEMLKIWNWTQLRESKWGKTNLVINPVSATRFVRKNNMSWTIHGQTYSPCNNFVHKRRCPVRHQCLGIRHSRYNINTSCVRGDVGCGGRPQELPWLLNLSHCWCSMTQ
jgi:hypothetical protein